MSSLEKFKKEKEALQAEWKYRYLHTPNDELLGLYAISDWWLKKLDILLHQYDTLKNPKEGGG